MVLIRKYLLTAQSRQKNYVDRGKHHLEFTVGDHVFLKVSPKRGLRHFGRSGKLSPRFIGPFKILDRIGAMAYRLALPSRLANVYKVFHIFLYYKSMSPILHTFWIGEILSSTRTSLMRSDQFVCWTHEIMFLDRRLFH